MGLFGSEGGGNDGLQIGTIVFCITISLIIAMLTPMVAPSYDSDTGYSYEDIFAQRASLEAFTGESMTNMAPWMLEAVYTPWTIGAPYHADDTGWAYGESIDYHQVGYVGTTTIGDTTYIYLDPTQKSIRPLSQYSDTVMVSQSVPSWWASNLNGDLNIFGWVALYAGIIPYETKQVPTDVNSWAFTGYRYSFDPMLKIDYTDPSNPAYSTPSQQDAKLSIVWYEDQYGQGLSSGLVLMNDRTHGIIANLNVSDIVSSYNSSNDYSSKYRLDFDGVNVYINIRFDADVIAGNVDLRQAFDDGRWSLAISAQSMDNFMDIKNSNSLSTSVGNLVDTYSKIMTFDMPNVPFYFQVILWVLCVLPLMMAVMMFFTRSLLTAGIGAGVLGSILAIGLM